MEKKKFEWKESLKKFKWKERLSCLIIVCGILLIGHLSLLRSSIRGFIASNFYIPLLIVIFLCLILNFRIAAVGFPLGHMFGMIFSGIFGGSTFNSHLVWYIVVAAIIIVSAIAGEVLCQLKTRKKAEKFKQNVTGVKKETKNGEQISGLFEEGATEAKTEKKTFKWEERINCLAIAYGVFVVIYLVTRIWRTPTSLAIHASDNMFATLMICAFFVLIPNLKIVAIGFPIGHILGLIFAAIFGKEVIYPNSGGAVITTYWAEFLQASIFTTLVAIVAEVAFRVIKRSKTKLSKAVEERC